MEKSGSYYITRLIKTSARATAASILYIVPLAHLIAMGLRFWGEGFADTDHTDLKEM